MTKMTKIDKASLIALRPEIEAALKDLGERLGVSFRTGNGTYGGNEGSFKLEIKIDDPAIQEAAARAEFEKYCRVFDLQPTDFGLEFSSGPKRYKVTGLNLGRKGSKFPIKATDLGDGRAILLSELAVAAIKLARPTA